MYDLDNSSRMLPRWLPSGQSFPKGHSRTCRPNSPESVEAWTQDLWGCPEVSGTRALAADPFESCGLQSGASMDWTWIWGTRSTSSALYHIFRAIPLQFFRTGRECLCYVGLYLISDGVWVGRMCQLGIHRTQSFPAEHCFVTRESLLFTSIFSG